MHQQAVLTHSYFDTHINAALKVKKSLLSVKTVDRYYFLICIYCQCSNDQLIINR